MWPDEIAEIWIKKTVVFTNNLFEMSFGLPEIFTYTFVLNDQSR